MANFNYTAGVKFQPFSFEEMLRPLAMYTQEYNAIEQAYGDLNTKANEIAALANETDDPITYQRYKDFENSLRSKADTMAKQGLDTTSRRQLLDMRSRFATDITPIQNAIQRRNMLAEEQRKALLQNPTLMFQRDFNTRNYDTSLDRFLENANYDYGAQYSGALLTQEVSKMASNLARELRNISTGKLDEYTNTFLKKYGLSTSEVMRAIQDPTDHRGARALSAIYQSAVDKVPEELRELYKDQIRDYATQGFWSAIGQDQVSTYANQEAIAGLKGNNKKGKGINIPHSTLRIPVGKSNKNRTSPILTNYSNILNVGKDGNTMKKITIQGSDARLRSKFSEFEEPTFEYSKTQKDFDLFNKDNKLMTKEQFINQAKGDKQYQKGLKEFYEANVEPLLNRYGDTNANAISFNDLSDMQQIEQNLFNKEGTSTFMDVINFPVGSTIKDLEDNLENLINEEVWSLGSSDKDSSLQRVASKKALRDILSDENKDKRFNVYLSEQEGKEAFIIRMNDEILEIPINKESSIGRDLLKEMKLHKYYVSQDDEDAAKSVVQRILSKAGFYSGYKYRDTESRVISSTGLN